MLAPRIIAEHATEGADSITDVLERIDQWPSEHAAAAAIVGERTFTHGDAERIFALASVTKPLVAYAVMIAVEEGALELDDAVGPGGARVEQLLAHLGGVGFGSRELEKQPGQRRIYSSAGFEILAETIENATGFSFPDYFDEAVCKPLNMRSTTLTGSAGHGAQASLNDLVSFAREVIHPTLIHPSTRDAMLSIVDADAIGVVPGYGMYRPCPWGLGFEIKGTKNPHWTGTSMPAHTAGHFGQAGTFLWVDVPGDRAGIALTDKPFGPWAKPLWAPFNDALYQAMKKPL
nr:serine hydrolase domain-containing protein [Corynebacterium aquilae]